MALQQAAENGLALAVITQRREQKGKENMEEKIIAYKGFDKDLSGRSISEIARMAIGYAMGRLEWAEE